MKPGSGSKGRDAAPCRPGSRHAAPRAPSPTPRLLKRPIFRSPPKCRCRWTACATSSPAPTRGPSRDPRSRVRNPDTAIHHPTRSRPRTPACSGFRAGASTPLQAPAQPLPLQRPQMLVQRRARDAGVRGQPLLAREAAEIVVSPIREAERRQRRRRLQPSLRERPVRGSVKHLAGSPTVRAIRSRLPWARTAPSASSTDLATPPSPGRCGPAPTSGTPPATSASRRRRCSASTATTIPTTRAGPSRPWTAAASGPAPGAAPSAARRRTGAHPEGADLRRASRRGRQRNPGAARTHLHESEECSSRIEPGAGLSPPSPKANSCAPVQIACRALQGVGVRGSPAICTAELALKRAPRSIVPRLNRSCRPDCEASPGPASETDSATENGA